MDSTTVILLKEYDNLEFVFGKYFMTLMFRDFAGYVEVRDECTFYEVRDSLSEMVIR